MAWITPVTNRTAGSKGYWDVATSNRIEGNTAHVAGELATGGYYIPVATKTWALGDFPFRDEIDRIRDNVKAIYEQFCHFSVEDIRYIGSLNYEDANTLERILRDARTLTTGMTAAYRHSGTFSAGQEGLRR